MISLIKERRNIQAKPMNTETKPLDILMAISNATGVPMEHLKSRKRDAHLVKTRGIYAYIASEFSFRLVDIGSPINRDHSTVIYYLKHFRDRLSENEPWYDAELAREIANLKRRLRIRLIDC